MRGVVLMVLFVAVGLAARAQTVVRFSESELEITLPEGFVFDSSISLDCRLLDGLDGEKYWAAYYGNTLLYTDQWKNNKYLVTLGLFVIPKSSLGEDVSAWLEKRGEAFRQAELAVNETDMPFLGSVFFRASSALAPGGFIAIEPDFGSVSGHDEPGHFGYLCWSLDDSLYVVYAEMGSAKSVCALLTFFEHSLRRPPR